MFVADAGSSSESGVNSELKCVPRVSPGKIVENVVYWGLSVMAVIESLIQTVKRIPFLFVFPMNPVL